MSGPLCAMTMLCFLSLVLGGCDEPKPKEVTNSARAAAAESLAVLYSPDARERAREAAALYLSVKGISIQGLSAIELDSSNYIITADVGESVPMVQLVVRQFFTAHGTHYWKAAPLDLGTAQIYGTIAAGDSAGATNLFFAKRSQPVLSRVTRRTDPDIPQRLGRSGFPISRRHARTADTLRAPPFGD